MFAAPPTVKAETVALLPSCYHVRGRISDRYEGRPFYLEGPSMSRTGTLYFTDIPGGRIFRLVPGAEIELFLEYDGEPNGTKIHADGRIFVADNKNGILAIDPQTRCIETVLNRVDNEGLRGPNDLTFSLSGDIYFTDQGNSDIQRPTGRVVRLRRDGTAEILLDRIPSPNGLVLSPDEQFLYVAVTRTNAIWKVPLTVPPGLVPGALVGTTGVFIQMSGGTGPDGLAVDADGNLVVAHTGMGCLWLFSPAGEPLLRVNTSAGPSVSNVVFGGEDNRTMFITESSHGAIMTAVAPRPGHVLFSHVPMAVGV